MLFGSFLGDSHSLGVHWVYNTRAIDKKVGRVEELIAPIVNRFHPNRGKGEFTHYGDQSYFLLEYLSNHNEFLQEEFLSAWADYMRSYDGYMDHATEDTLKNIDKGEQGSKAASLSHDLGGAARTAPLIYRYAPDKEKTVQVCREQTEATHNNRNVVDSSSFFAEMTLSILEGGDVEEGLEAAVTTLPDQSELRELAAAGAESKGADSRETITHFGQACPVEKLFPGTIHLLVTYQDDLQEALIQNAGAGGDSATRGLIVGMVLGAYHGYDALPQSWLEDLAAGEKILTLAEKIDKISG